MNVKDIVIFELQWLLRSDLIADESVPEVIHAVPMVARVLVPVLVSNPGKRPRRAQITSLVPGSLRHPDDGVVLVDVPEYLEMLQDFAAFHFACASTMPRKAGQNQPRKIPPNTEHTPKTEEKWKGVGIRGTRQVAGRKR